MAVLEYRQITEGRMTNNFKLPERKSSVSKEHIQSALTKRRESFLNEYVSIKNGEGVLAYEPELDRQVYIELQKYEGQGRPYSEVQQSLNDYTKYQLITHIGERLNVQLSTFRYDLRDGVMYGENTDEPFIDMIARGRDYRKIHGNAADHPREQAEVEEIAAIQKALGNDESSIGTMMLAISPPGEEGSMYSHNFYDIFTLKEDEKKNRYIETRRYSSALSNEEYIKKIAELQPDYFKEKTNEMSLDAFLLSHPLSKNALSQFTTPDDIHTFLHQEHPHMSEEDFNQVIQICTPLILSYINTLCSTPGDKQFLDITFNAILNKADAPHQIESWENVSTRRHREIGIESSFSGIPSRADITRLGMQEVRTVQTGCGGSGGVNVETDIFGGTAKRKPGNTSPFSVSEFGEDKYGSRTFECPSCHRTNERPYNELVPECQHCQSKDVAC